MDQIKTAVIILLSIFVVFTSFLIYVFLERLIIGLSNPDLLRNPGLHGVIGCLLSIIPIVILILKILQSRGFDFSPNWTTLFVFGLPLIIWQSDIGRFVPFLVFSLSLMILMVSKRFFRFIAWSGLLLLLLLAPLLFGLETKLTWHYGLAFAMAVFANYVFNRLFSLNKNLSVATYQARIAAAEFANANVKLQNSMFFNEESIRTRERKEIAHEVHDVVGHSLMAVLVQLRNTHKIAVERPQDLGDTLDELVEIVDETLQEVRRKVYALEDSDELSLSWPIKWRRMCLIFSECTGLKIQLRIPEAVATIDGSIGEGIFRIIQESLTNSVKHGNASYVDITFLIDEATNSLLLRISDNGTGHEADIVRGVGLKGMSERIADLHGSIAFETLPGLGFDIGIKLPWTERT